MNQYNTNQNYNVDYDQLSNLEPLDFTAKQGGYYDGTTSGFQGITRIMTSDLLAYSFLFMVAALIITAVASVMTPLETAIRMISGRAYLVVCLAELGLVMGAQAAIKRNNALVAGILFAIYSYVTGMLFSIFYVLYTQRSLAGVFIICAGMFGVTAAYGMVTKNNLASLGSLCTMGLIGLIIAGVVNLVFLRNGLFDLVMSVFGVFVFVGLTAYDVNKASRLAEECDSDSVMALSMYCALELYLDFINLFLRLLRIMGKKKR